MAATDRLKQAESGRRPSGGNRGERQRRFCRRRSVIGGDIFDLQLLATMQANNLLRIHTFDIEDFEERSRAGER